MSVETLQYLSMGSYILAGVMALVTMILFVVYEIPAVIGTLTGATARKAIKHIRKQQNRTSEELVTYAAQSANVRTMQQRVNETTLLEIAKETTLLKNVNQTVMLHGTSKIMVPIVVEYEIGFWISTEIIE